MRFWLHLGSQFGVICMHFAAACAVVVFATPLVRKLYFGGSGHSLSGTLSAIFWSLFPDLTFQRLWLHFGIHFGAGGTPD